MLFGHGFPKLGEVNARFHSFPDPFNVGSEFSFIMTIFSEVICAILLILGFFTRFAVIPLFVTMIVAAFIIHIDDPWAKQEFALLYAIYFLMFFIAGPGRISVDHALFKKTKY